MCNEQGQVWVSSRFGLAKKVAFGLGGRSNAETHLFQIKVLTDFSKQIGNFWCDEGSIYTERRLKVFIIRRLELLCCPMTSAEGKVP